jgi:hypothetical protein
MAVTLSSVSAHPVGIPSSGPSGTSVGMPRLFVVAGATSSAPRTGIAIWRVRMQAGQRTPASRPWPRGGQQRAGSKIHHGELVDGLRLACVALDDGLVNLRLPISGQVGSDRLANKVLTSTALTRGESGAWRLRPAEAGVKGGARRRQIFESSRRLRA